MGHINLFDFLLYFFIPNTSVGNLFLFYVSQGGGGNGGGGSDGWGEWLAVVFVKLFVYTLLGFDDFTDWYAKDGVLYNFIIGVFGVWFWLFDEYNDWNVGWRKSWSTFWFNLFIQLHPYQYTFTSSKPLAPGYSTCIEFFGGWKRIYFRTDSTVDPSAHPPFYSVFHSTSFNHLPTYTNSLNSPTFSPTRPYSPGSIGISVEFDLPLFTYSRKEDRSLYNDFWGLTKEVKNYVVGWGSGELRSIDPEVHARMVNEKVSKLEDKLFEPVEVNIDELPTVAGFDLLPLSISLFYYLLLLFYLRSFFIKHRYLLLSYLPLFARYFFFFK